MDGSDKDKRWHSNNTTSTKYSNKWSTNLCIDCTKIVLPIRAHVKRCINVLVLLWCLIIWSISRRKKCYFFHMPKTYMRLHSICLVWKSQNCKCNSFHCSYHFIILYILSFVLSPALCRHMLVLTRKHFCFTNAEVVFSSERLRCWANEFRNGWSRSFFPECVVWMCVSVLQTQCLKIMLLSLELPLFFEHVWVNVHGTVRTKKIKKIERERENENETNNTQEQAAVWTVFMKRKKE